MKKWPIAIQVYTVDKEATADFEGTARALKAMGYDGVELCDTYGGTAVGLKKICDEMLYGKFPTTANWPEKNFSSFSLRKSASSRRPLT